MRTLPGKIIIQSDLDQKQTVKLESGASFFLPPRRQEYEANGRESNPVLARVIEINGSSRVNIGDYIVMHHNLIFDQSYKVYGKEGMSVIPDDRWVLATVANDGSLNPLYPNILCKRIPKESHDIYYTPEGKYYTDRVEVIKSSIDSVVSGDIIFILKWADYEVVYHHESMVKREVVVWNEDVTGIQKKNEDMKPLRDYVLIKPDPTEEQSEGGYVIPEADKEKPKRGTVVSVGPGTYAKDTGVFIPVTVKPGDEVYYGKYQGTQVDDTDMLLMKEDCLLGVEEKRKKL